MSAAEKLENLKGSLERSHSHAFEYVRLTQGEPGQKTSGSGLNAIVESRAYPLSLQSCPLVALNAKREIKERSGYLFRSTTKPRTLQCLIVRDYRLDQEHQQHLTLDRGSET